MTRANLRNIQKSLATRTVLLVTNFYNIFYLCGFEGVNPAEREAIIMLTPEKIILFLPAMYGETAKNLPLIGEKKIRLILDSERDGLYSIWKKYVPKNTTTIFFEDHDLTVAELAYTQKRTHWQWRKNPQPIENHRVKKTKTEINALKKAARITDETFLEVVDFLKRVDYTRYTEEDIASLIQNISRKRGGQGLGFPSIVACGPSSSQPHYMPKNKGLQQGQPLLLDFGIRYNGYTADLTRMVFLGKAPHYYKKIYRLVLVANQKAIQLCRSGQPVQKLIETVNSYFQKHHLLSHYLHGLGHGVGLEVHEQPFLRGGGQTLQEGMVITIEPGLYFSKQFGIRIEDMILIKTDGRHILSEKSPKNLIEITKNRGIKEG